MRRLAVPCSHCDGVLVQREDSEQVRVKPKCGTIAQRMRILEELPPAPRFCRQKACQAISSGATVVLVLGD